MHEEGRQGHKVPGNADGLRPKWPRSAIQGFAAGDAQHHGAEQEKAAEAVVQKKLDRVPGINRGQDLGPLDDGQEADQADDAKPEDHDGAEKFADAAGAMTLGPKEGEAESRKPGAEPRVWPGWWPLPALPGPRGPK